MQNGNIYLTPTGDQSTYHKYTYSNGMALSVKLGIWEELLDKYIESIEPVTLVLLFLFTIPNDRLFFKRNVSIFVVLIIASTELCRNEFRRVNSRK